jgi:hypothetical protein
MNTWIACYRLYKAILLMYEAEAIGFGLGIKRATTIHRKSAPSQDECRPTGMHYLFRDVGWRSIQSELL